MTAQLDEIDRGILHLLQNDARDRTTVEMGERLGVSSSTIATRIDSLEDRGVITDYQPVIDYEQTDCRHHFLIVGTVPFDPETSILDDVMAVSGVVGARELLTNEENVSIEFVGRTREEVESTVADLDRLGVDVNRMEVVRSRRRRPYADFGGSKPPDGDG